MAEPRHKPARLWAKEKRFEHAVKACLDEGMSLTQSALKYGVTRQALSPRVKKATEQRQDLVARARAETAAKAGIGTVSNERRRVPDFWEFDRLYFGGLVCPDCGVHHETPDFHREIIEAVESDSRRVLINVAPFHSKSTLVTVKHTIYDLVRNPNSRTIIVSAASDLANLFVGQIQEWLENPEVFENSPRNLIEDWGPFNDSKSSWNENRLVVAGRMSAEKDPTVQALGWGKKIYGKRADRIKFDDIADNDNQATPEGVAKMLRWINKMALSRIGKTGQGVFIGTRIDHGDIYGHFAQMPSYRRVRFSCILDDVNQQVLWPEHFPYSQALIHRDEMSAAEFQLVYQNVDIPGDGACFPAELVESCKDTHRHPGHYETEWRLVAGLDPAGGNKNSGFTAITVLAVDLNTGRRFVVLSEAHKAMKAHQVKDRMLEIGRSMPISEWRIEANGLQSQIYQYDQELVRELALMGQRVLPHFTHRNKWDPQFGVESMAPFFHAGMMSIPWGNAQAHRQMQPLIEELIAFPMGSVSDRVMSLWFADLAARELLRRDHMPMFNERSTRNWPARVKRRRRVVDFHAREVRRVPLRDQRPGHMTMGQANYRRQTVGVPTPYPDLVETEPVADGYANIDGSVDDPPWKEPVL